MHLDFLKNDVKTKALRYSVHDYMVRRIHRSTVFKIGPSALDCELFAALLELREDEKYRNYY